MQNPLLFIGNMPRIIHLAVSVPLAKGETRIRLEWSAKT
jgi:hypothetical protein